MTAKVARDLSLYVVTDTSLSLGRSHREVAEAAVAGGATVVQLRDKQAEARELYEVGRVLREVCSRAGALLIVNDRADLAIAVDADGVHVGQDDLPATVVRKLLGPGKIVGVSTEKGIHAEQAERDGADYVAIGPIYEARGSKSNAGPPVGLKIVAEIRRHTSLPIVAIGGIKHEHVAEVIGEGADGLAVISAVVGAEDIAGAARQMRRLINEARGE